MNNRGPRRGPPRPPGDRPARGPRDDQRGPRDDQRGPRDDQRGPRGAQAPLNRPQNDRPHNAGPRDDRPRDDRPRDDRPRPAPQPAIQRPGERVIYGAGPVGELVARRPESVRAIWVDPQRAGRSTSDPVAAIVVNGRAAGIRVEDHERKVLEQAAGPDARHQGVVAWLGPFEYSELEALIPAEGPALVIALDGVEDPRNLGAIVRSAYLLGAHGIIIPEHRAAEITAIAAKTSAGASELLPIAKVGNLVRALDDLRELGLWRVAVAATEDAQPIDTIDASLPLCLVLGAEGTGVRPLVAKNCDFHAVIPMAAARAAVGSFNVSVAAALALYEIHRRRG